MKINNNNLEGTIKTLRKTVLSSLDKRYVDKRKITTSNDTYTRYSYILNNPYDIKQNIHEFLLRERNIDIPVEIIDSIIGKYIPK